MLMILLTPARTSFQIGLEFLLIELSVVINDTQILVYDGFVLIHFTEIFYNLY